MPALRWQGKKYVALYFSAHLCPPCRAFTPKLIDWYQNQSGSADQFEIVFVSSDRSEEGMEDHMKETGMPWPAVDFKKIQRSGIRKFAGSGTPCLVLIGPDGSVVSHSFQGETYVGSSRVLADLEKILAGSGNGRVASGRDHNRRLRFGLGLMRLPRQGSPITGLGTRMAAARAARVRTCLPEGSSSRAMPR